MAYIRFTPATREGGDVLVEHPRRKRAVERIVRPRRTGWTLIRTGGVWRQVATPTTDDQANADLDTDGQRLFLLGGHWHHILDATYSEILAAGFTGSFEIPGSEGAAYPSSTTYPSSTLYPGAI